MHKLILRQIMFLFFIVICFTPFSKGKSPSLEFAPSTINIGEHCVGKKVKTKVVITNVGSKSVNIKKIKASCGCTSTKLISSTIKPGKPVKLEIEIDSVGKKGDFKGKVWIFTNDDKQIYTIEIIGKFYTKDNQMVTFPNYVAAGSVNCGSTVHRAISLQRNGNTPIGKTEITTSVKWIDVNSIKVNDGLLRLQVTINIPQKQTGINEEILIKGVDKEDFIRIPIRGNILPKIQISPSIVLIKSNHKEFEFLLKTYDNNKPNLKSYEFKGNGLKVVSCNMSPKQNDLIKVVIEKQTACSQFTKGVLSFEFDEKYGKVEITFLSTNISEVSVEKECQTSDSLLTFNYLMAVFAINILLKI